MFLQNRFSFFICNLLWYLSSLPSWFIFYRQTRKLQQTQTKLLKKYFKLHKTLVDIPVCSNEAELLSSFQKIPLQEYEDISCQIQDIRNGKTQVFTSDPVILLEPTGGTSQGTKLVPYNRTFQKEYQKAITPWIADLFFRFPALLSGSHYWSISPNTAYDDRKASVVPIGFEEDAEYLSSLQNLVSSFIMAVPSAVAKIKDIKTFEYLTLLFLVKERNLRLISIWHPSYLTILIDHIAEYMPQIIKDLENGTISRDLKLTADLTTFFNKRISVDSKRVAELKGVDLSQVDFSRHIWPKLQVISCWGGGMVENWIAKLQGAFPDVEMHYKGIIATEGVISIPFKKEQQHVLAIGSHFFEFCEVESGKCKFAWEVEVGRIYSVILTNGGGLLRYQLHDLVEVSGFFNQTPVLRFIGRESSVSDIAGEKLHYRQAEEMIQSLARELVSDFEFAFLNPMISQQHKSVGKYILYLYGKRVDAIEVEKIEKFAEEFLCRNYHYKHARNLGQLEHLSLIQLKKNPDREIRTFLANKGQKLGDIKINCLIPNIGLSEVLSKLAKDN